MGQTLTNNIYLPDEGERNCYAGLAANWRALDAHLGNTDIHVTYADKQAWNEHVADTVKHVTASDKQTWNGKQDALSQTQLDAVNSGIDSSKVQQIATNTSDISSLQSGKANDSDVVHKSGNETINGNKTFSSINGVKPSSLSLPSDNTSNFIDISSYITYLNGTVNTYTAPANGWISIIMSNSSSVQAFIYGLWWGHQVVRPSAGGIRFLMPILKDKTANIFIFNGTIDSARFIPCQGNE